MGVQSFIHFHLTSPDACRCQVLPTYKLVQAGVFGKDLENPQEIDGSSYEVGGAWASKLPHVYFRGRPSNAVRTEVMERAKTVPELDIAITKNHFNYFPDDAAREEHRQCVAVCPPAILVNARALIPA
jgi:hypothetical protein